MGSLRSIIGRRLVRNFAYLATAEVLTRVLSFATLVIVVRVVGPGSFGYLAIAQAVLAWAAVVADLGLTAWMQRHIAAHPAQAREEIPAVTGIQLATGALLGAVMVSATLALALEPELELLLVLSVPALITQSLSLMYVLQALERIGTVAVIRLVIQLVVTAVTIGLVLVTRAPAAVVVAGWCGVLVGDVMCLIVVARQGWLRFPTGRVPLAGIVGRGLPFLGIAAVAQVQVHFDVLVLGALRPPEEVGQYAAAARLVAIALSFATIVVIVAQPRLVRVFSDASPAFTAMAGALVTLAWRIGLAGSALLVVTGSELVPLLLGPAFAEAGSLMSVLALWIPLGLVNAMAALAMVAAGRQARLLRIMTLGAVVSLTALPVAAALDGARGVAFAVVGREALLLAVLAVTVRGLGIDVPARLLRHLDAFAIPVAALLALRILLPASDLLLAFGVWAAAVVVAEAVHGWPLARELAVGSEPDGRASPPAG